MTNPQHQWQRQPGESSAAYTAFECYRDLGPGRTVEAAWGEYKTRRGLKKARPPHHFYDWKRDHEWEARTSAFDSDVSVVKVEAQVEAIQAATGIFYDEATKVAKMLVEIALGIEEGTSAQVAACRDILDRIGVTRKRAEASQVVGTQNNQFNFDLGGADVKTLIALAEVLG